METDLSQRVFNANYTTESRQLFRQRIFPISYKNRNPAYNNHDYYSLSLNQGNILFPIKETKQVDVDIEFTGVNRNRNIAEVVPQSIKTYAPADITRQDISFVQRQYVFRRTIGPRIVGPHNAQRDTTWEAYKWLFYEIRLPARFNSYIDNQQVYRDSVRQYQRATRAEALISIIGRQFHFS